MSTYDIAKNQLQPEVWKDISGYEGLYQVSNLGRVKALPKTYFTGENHLSQRFKVEHILKHNTHPDGYLRVSLRNNGNARMFLVHRLVAASFICNPNNSREVNHKDGVKTNNLVENLEWATRLENMRHSYKTGLNKGKKRGEHSAAKLILDTQTGVFYDCMKDAAEAKSISYKNLQNRLLGIVKNNTGLVSI